MGYLRTAILLAAITALFLIVGYALGGEQGMIMALLFAGATNLFAYWNSDKIVLRLYNGQEIGPREHPELYNMVQDLSRNAELPMPKVYITPQEQPNAFATGRNPDNAAVAVSQGLLRLLNNGELAGVVAHELAHIKHRDTLLMTLTATVAGAIGALTHFAMLFGGRNNRQGGIGPIGVLFAVIVAPLAASLVQMAISRSREYEADRIGAEICRNPLWLTDALRKIAPMSKRTVNSTAEQNPATAHLFIMNPLHVAALGGLFSTHPPVELRIQKLQAMAPHAARDATTSINPWG